MKLRGLVGDRECEAENIIFEGKLLSPTLTVWVAITDHPVSHR